MLNPHLSHLPHSEGDAKGHLSTSSQKGDCDPNQAATIGTMDTVEGDGGVVIRHWSRQPASQPGRETELPKIILPVFKYLQSKTDPDAFPVHWALPASQFQEGHMSHSLPAEQGPWYT